MKFYVVSTYQKGNIIIRARNKNDVIEKCNDDDLDIIDIVLLSTYYNKNYCDEAMIIGEIY